MKSINPHFLIIIFLFFLFSCNNDEESENFPPTAVQITNIEINYNTTPLTIIAHWTSAVDHENEAVKYRVFFEKYLTDSEETEVIDTRFFEDLAYFNDEVDQSERYRIRVIAVDIHNNESIPAIQDLNITPINQPPTTPSSITIDQNLLVHWNESTDPEGDDIIYVATLEKYLPEIDDYEDVRRVFTNNTSTGANILNRSLTEQDSYRIKIVATNNFQNESEPIYKDVIIEDLINKPPPVIVVENIEFSEIDVNHIIVTWNESIDPEGENVHYVAAILSLRPPDFDHPDPYWRQDSANTNIQTTAVRFNLRHDYFQFRQRIIVLAIDERGISYSALIIDLSDVLHPNPIEFFTHTDNVVYNGDSDYTFNWEIDHSINGIDHLELDFKSQNNSGFYTLEHHFVLDSNTTTYNINVLDFLKFYIAELTVVFTNTERLKRTIRFPVMPIGTYNGDIHISNYYEYLPFLNHQIDAVNGNVFILGVDTVPTDDSSILSSINQISGNLELGQYFNSQETEDPFANLNLTIGGTFICKSTFLEELNLSNISFNGLDIQNMNVPTIQINNSTSSLSNLILKNNSSLNNLIGFSNITVINENLEINNSAFTDLDFLSTITQFGNDILIKNNANLNAINGFSSNFSIMGNLEISNNSLNSLGGFNGLTQVNNLIITNNNSLNSISGFTSLSSIQNNLNIQNNANLFEINAFSNNFTITGNLEINNNALATLEGFNGLTQVNNLSILNNTNLNSINGFSNNLSITGNLDINNNGLTSLNGFVGLSQVNNLIISNNNSLNSISGFTNLSLIQNDLDVQNNGLNSLNSFNNLTQIGNDLIIRNNANLNTINGFSNNFSITGNLDIGNNIFLTSIDGFIGLTQVNNLSITSNNDLSSISGFTNLSTIQNDLNIQNNGLNSLNSFNNLVQIGNDFIIRNNANLNDINGFSNNFSITRNLEINNNGLTSLNGFNGLTQVNKLSITNNNNLSSSSGFNNLNTINDKLIVQSNPQLNNLNNFTNLNFLGNGLLISNNTNLTTLNLNTFSSNVNNVFEINITNNTNLSSIQGLSNLQHIDKLLFKDNNNLATFDLTNLTTVANYIALINNDSVSTLDFLTNLTLIDCGTEYSFNGHNGNLFLEGNFNLHDFCGLIDFFTNTGLCSNEYYINQNAFNPTHQDIINGNCSN